MCGRGCLAIAKGLSGAGCGVTDNGPGSLTVGNDGFSGSLGLSIDLILLKIRGTHISGVFGVYRLLQRCGGLSNGC